MKSTSSLIHENGIAPVIQAVETLSNKGLQAMKEASRIAEENGISDMTLDEINAEIKAVRENRI